MGDVYFVIVPVVIVVVVLKLCLIFWRIWVYQKRREQQRIYCAQQQRAIAAATTARVVRVERCVGPDGFAQRNTYAISQPGLPTRHLQRTIVVRPSNDRPNDPNMPPTYDQAVTGKDKSVKVEEGGSNQPPPPGGAAPSAPPPTGPATQPPVAQPGTFRSALLQPPSGAGVPPPPAYTQAAPAPSAAPVINRRGDGDDVSLDANDRTRLLA